MSRPRISILLVCEQPQQLTGSGCCGKLEGDNALCNGGNLFLQTRQKREAFGLLYRAVQRLFTSQIQRGEIVIDTVDPRNQLYLVPRLWRDVGRYRPGWRAGLVTSLQLFALPAVIVNGRVRTRGGEPIDPDELCHVISQLLESRQTEDMPVEQK